MRRLSKHRTSKHYGESSLPHQENGRRPEQLELPLAEPDGGEEAVDDVAPEEEDVRVAALVGAHVQHPLGNHAAHVRPETK